MQLSLHLCDVENWRKYKFAIISNIDERTDKDRVRTVKYEERSNDDANTNYKALRPSNILKPPGTGKYDGDNKAVQFTYAQIAKKAL